MYRREMITGHNSNEARITDPEGLTELEDHFRPSSTLSTVNNNDETYLTIHGGNTAFSTEKPDAERAFLELLGEDHLEEPLVVRSYTDRMDEMVHVWQWNVHPDGTVEYETLQNENEIAGDN